MIKKIISFSTCSVNTKNGNVKKCVLLKRNHPKKETTRKKFILFRVVLSYKRSVTDVSELSDVSEA